jgi:hypothetical protein
MLRDAHNASRFGLGVARIRGLWAFCFWVIGGIRSDAAFSCADLPLSDSFITLQWCLPAYWSLRGRSWPWLGARDAAALRQLYYFFTQGRLDLEHLSPAGVAGREAPPAPGRTRLAVRPGAHVSPLFSGASGGQDRHGRPEPRGRIAPIMTEVGMARPCLGVGCGAGVARRGPRAHRPCRPATAAAGRPPGRGGAPGSDAPAVPRAAGDEILPASPAKPFGMTGHRL